MVSPINPESIATEALAEQDERQLSTRPRAARTEGEKARDLEIISTLYLRGKKPGEIAEELVARFGYRSMSAQQIGEDLRGLREIWVQSALINYDQAKAREIAHVDELESAAWDAWNKSWGKTKTVVQEGIEDKFGHRGDSEETLGKKPTTYLRKRGTETTKELRGDPRYLDTIKWCIEQRCKILGLHEPMRLAISWKEEATKFGITPEKAEEMFNQMVNGITKQLRDHVLDANALAIPANILEAEFEDAEYELPDDID